MKKIAKNIFLKTAGFVLSAALILFSHFNTYAYDYYTYESDEMGIIVDPNKPDAESTVVLYLYVDSSDRDIMYTKSIYCFECTSQRIDEFVDHVDLQLKYRPENKKVYATLDGGEVWVWQFGIENGDYIFANGYGNYSSTYTLTQDMILFPYPEGMYAENQEEVLSVENETIRLYALRGSQEWQDANLDSFITWATETELGFRGVEDGMELSESVQNGNMNETISIEIEPTITIEEITQSPEPSAQSTETEAIEIPEAVVDDVPEESEESNMVVPIVALVAIVLILLFAIIKILKRR